MPTFPSDEVAVMTKSDHIAYHMAKEPKEFPIAVTKVRIGGGT